MVVDSGGALYLNDSMLLSAMTLEPQVVNVSGIAPGYMKLTITLFGGTGWDRLSLYVGINSTAITLIPPSRIYAVPPGAPLAVSLVANGVTAQPACSATTLSANTAIVGPYPPFPPTIASEAASVAVASGTCAYMYSSYLTPQLVSALTVSGVAASSLAGMGPSGIHSPSPGTLQVRACVCACAVHAFVHVQCRVCGRACARRARVRARACAYVCACVCVCARTCTWPHA